MAERAAVDTPTTEELYTSAGEHYDLGRQYGKYFDFDPSYMADLANGVQNGLNQDGMHPMLAPASHAVLSDLQKPSNGEVLPFTGVEAARRTFANIAQGNNPTDAAAAKRAIGALTDFMENPPSEAIIPGSAGPFAAQAAANKAGDLYAQGRGDYAAAKRSDKVEGAGEYAKFKASSANSGSNVDNNIRQQVRPLIDPRHVDRRLAGFTPDERQAVEGVVNGSGSRNFLRTTGNVLGGGGGLGRLATGAVAGNAGAGVGYLAAGPIGSAVGSTLGATIVPSIGAAARAGANSLAQRDLAAAAETIRQRSPLFQERQAAAPMVVNPNVSGKAAMGATLGAGTNDDQQPAYAKGGSVKKPTHEFLVQRLMKLAEKAKKTEKKVTAPILNMPDDTVTDALARAQKAL
jgi:flagellar hook-basal body complex protein FliE